MLSSREYHGKHRETGKHFTCTYEFMPCRVWYWRRPFHFTPRWLAERCVEFDGVQYGTLHGLFAWTLAGVIRKAEDDLTDFYSETRDSPATDWWV